MAEKIHGIEEHEVFNDFYGHRCCLFLVAVESNLVCADKILVKLIWLSLRAISFLTVLIVLGIMFYGLHHERLYMRRDNVSNCVIKHFLIYRILFAFVYPFV